MTLKNTLHHQFLPLTFFVTLFVLLADNTNAQTVWLESFDGLGNGTTIDAGATAWTRDVSACNLSSGHFEVQSQLFSANNTDGEGVWTSEWVDISSATSIRVTLDVAGVGTLDANGANADYFAAYYRIDAGPEINFTTQLGPITNGQPATCGSISGDSIQVVVRAHNTGSDEYYRWENVLIEAVNVPTGTANTIYSVANGDWNSGSTWSLTSGGAACSCTPTATSDVRIECGYTVNMNADGDANMVHISSGAALEWTNNDVELNMHGNATVTVMNGARMDQNGRSNAELEFESAGTSTITVDDATNGIDLDDIEVKAVVDLTINGAGTISLDDDFDLDAACTVTNNLTGTFTIGDNIDFDASGSTFINNETINITDNLDLNSANNVTITNNGTLDMDGDLDANASDDVTLTNNAGASIYVRGDDIELSSNSDRFRINNYGTIEIEDDLKESPGGANAGVFYNYANATLRIGHNSSDMNWLIYADYTGSTVDYSRNGNQDRIWVPQDAYWNLSVSGSGRKRTIGNLEVNGDLTISNAAYLDVDNGNDNLLIGGNWVQTSSAGDPFVQGNETVTFDGMGDFALTANGGETFYNLEIDMFGGTLTLNDDVTIATNGALSMTMGVVRSSGTNLLTISDDATSTAGNILSFIDGPVSKIGNDAFTFPTGDDNVWAPIALSNLSGFGTGDEYRAEFRFVPSPSYNNLDVGVDHVSLIEYWTLDQIGGAGTADVTLFWYDANRSQITDLTDLSISRYNTGPALWQLAGGTVAGGSTAGVGGTGSIATNTGTFGQFSFASLGGDNPLPIELIHFTAQAGDRAVSLSWVTASELNNDFFTIERSADGIHFQEVARVDGAGTTSEIREYADTDQSPLSGTSYYRLKQTDFDGTVSYSDLQAIEFTGTPEWMQPASIDATVYPNPAAPGSTIFLNLEGTTDTEVLVVVHDIHGHLKFTKVLVTESLSTHAVAIDPYHALTPGTYFITGTSDNSLFRKKLIVK